MTAGTKAIGGVTSTGLNAVASSTVGSGGAAAAGFALLVVVLFENADIVENAENVLNMLLRDVVVVVVAVDAVELRSEAGPAVAEAAVAADVGAGAAVFVAADEESVVVLFRNISHRIGWQSVVPRKPRIQMSYRNNFVSCSMIMLPCLLNEWDTREWTQHQPQMGERRRGTKR